MQKNIYTALLLTITCSFLLQAQLSDSQLRALIHKAEYRLRGKSSMAQITITTVRPRYTRSISLKTWTQGDDYSLMYIQQPVRDQGTTYLKRFQEIWYYLPSIERTIKMPPSMMNQRWMGTDLSNDDLVKKTSLSDDFEHRLLGTEKIDGLDCYHLALLPHEGSEVIWGKVEIWIEKEHANIMKQQFFDEDMELVNTMTAASVRPMDGVYVPTRYVFIPADKPNQQTVMEYQRLQFDVQIPSSYFTAQYMKRIKN